MSHTKEYSASRFHFNSDYSGKVTVVGADGESTEVPFGDIKQFVGDYYRDLIIKELNDADLSDDVTFITMMRLGTRVE